MYVQHVEHFTRNTFAIAVCMILQLKSEAVSKLLYQSKESSY